jgi:hypothetical protein
VIKIKPIIFSACAAFVLSFFTALAARSGLPVALIKAFVFGLLFGALAAGVQFVYAKFLADGVSAPEAAEEPRLVGSKVDLVVSEEDLPEDKDAPAFYVEGKHVLSNDDLVGKKSAVAADDSLSAARQNETLEAVEKVREQKAAENIAQKAAEIASPAPAAVELEAPPSVSQPQAKEAPAAFAPINLAQGASSAAPAAAMSGDDELDDLPDIGEIGGGSASEAEDGVIEDSEFAEEGMARPSRQTELGDGKVADVKDAPVMAEAIRTILKTEE